MSSLMEKSFNATSMGVFRKFVRYDERGCFISENIISKECFELWLSTRKVDIKHPRGSFRRAISAHIRGADDRIPFREEIEQSLVRKLRKYDSEGNWINPFRDLLDEITSLVKGSRKRLNIYKFPYGFHEKQRFLASNSIFKEIPGSNIISTKKEHVENNLCAILNMTENEMNKCLKYLKMNNISICFPALAYMLQNVPSSSFYFSKKYVLPEPEDQYFRRDLAVSIFTLDTNTTEITYMDESFKNIFGSSRLSIFKRSFEASTLCLDKISRLCRK
eukprot:snap_masked-scaffold_24-processed-gene-2.55-mRNA-1 protein AED:1.00 eAED:1.00 QI:0/0/0/0/1/1/6/0/275